MGIFSRISTLFSSKVNNTLDKLESPEPMLNQYIRDMDLEIERAHEALIKQTAFKVRIKNSLDAATAMSDLRLSNAQSAIESGNDDLAYRAMTEKKVQDENVAMLQSQLRDAEEKLIEFTTRFDEMKAERDSMVKRKTSIVSQHEFAKSLNKMDTVISMTSSSSAIANFERISDRIKRASEEAQARLEVRDAYRKSGVKEFEELARNNAVQTELDELKRKMQAK